MRISRSAICAFFLLLAVAGCGPRISVVNGPAKKAVGSVVLHPHIQLLEAEGIFEVGGLADSTWQALAKQDRPADWWSQVLTVRIDGARPDVPPLVGKYWQENNTLRFKPSYPLSRGVRYRAIFDPAGVPVGEGEQYVSVEMTFLLPKVETAPTVVTQVYPTRNVLPENQLKFYLHFSAPMSRGDVYEHIRLLDADGKPVDAPFLTLEQGLWAPNSERFTLLIDPGRIKRGLKPREDVGPSLEEGKSYTLEIDRNWPDANGEPLRETFRKSFRVGAPDSTQPDPKTWKLQVPAAGSTDPLTVTFPKSLDHAMLERVVWVTDEKDARIEGTVTISKEETCWQFLPKQAWRAGLYNLVADMILEDLAGNSIAKPFEVDEFHPVEQRIETKTVKVGFVVK
jgi:hypothetical protein